MSLNIIEQHPASGDLFAGISLMYQPNTIPPLPAPSDIQHFTHEGVQLAYSPTTGKCYRMFSSKWKLIKPGTSSRTYTVIKINGFSHLLHRIIAQHFLNDGKPLTSDVHIDHRLHANGSHEQDALSNLRITDKRGNMANLKHGSSKFAGASWQSQCNKWRVNIRINKQIKYIGLFKTEHEAAKAYIQTGEKHGYDMTIARERFYSIVGYAA